MLGVPRARVEKHCPRLTEIEVAFLASLLLQQTALMDSSFPAHVAVFYMMVSYEMPSEGSKVMHFHLSFPALPYTD